MTAMNSNDNANNTDDDVGNTYEEEVKQNANNEETNKSPSNAKDEGEKAKQPNAIKTLLSCKFKGDEPSDIQRCAQTKIK